MRYFITTLLLCLSLSLYSQFKVGGIITNQLNEPLIGATVVLLESQDSTMYGFSLTNDKGFFLVDDVEQGDYIIQVSYVAHKNYSQVLEVDWSSTSITLQTIVLSESTELLQEITIEAEHIPMGIRGDTISYNAAAFKTRPNATVEDLLRMLPGVEVERNGNIKAQGEDVENVLVDGKEFFGNNPTMATKNLEAKAVDKVEVYDKQSEMAEFTGIDDGQEEKTINLKLKEEYKEGGFGNVELDGGSEDRYSGRINYFRFSPTIQASIIGARNNINKETFSINDHIDFMGGFGNVMSSGGMINLSNMRENSDGINTSTSLGLNFNFDKGTNLLFRSHYLQTRLKNNLTQNSDLIGFNDQFNYSNIDTLINNRQNLNHQVNSKLTYKLSPFINLTLRNNLDWGDARNERNENSVYFQEGTLKGETNSYLNTLTDDIAFESNAIIKTKFNKDGRNLIANLTFRTGKDNANDEVVSFNNIAFNAVNLNQNQLYQSQRKQLDVAFKYTEPLSPKYYLNFNYAFNRNQERPVRDYFDVENGNLILNEDLTANYEKLYTYQVAGVSLRRNVKKLKMELGLSGQLTNLEGIINEDQNRIDGEFKHLLPYFTLDYTMKGSKSLGANYRTSIIAPQLDQLLPLPDNTNANYKYIGNPGLLPEYRQDFNCNFNLFDNFNFTSLWINLGASFAKNRIVNKTFVDENLFQTIEPINSDRYHDLTGYLSFSKPFKPLKINYKIRTNVRLASYDSFINNLESSVKDNNYNFRFSINNRNTDLINLESGISFNYNTRAYGINPDFNQAYFNTDYFLDFDIYLPKNWTLRSEFTFTKYSSESFADSPNYKLWSASIGKLFFENKLEIRASVFDILNENIGYRRSGDSNSIQQTYYNNLQQYFLLGMTYKIGNGKKDDGFHIEID